MEFFSSKVTGYNLTKKRPHERFFHKKFVGLVRTHIYYGNFWLMIVSFRHLWDFTSVLRSYSISPFTLRWLPLLSSIKTIIIWLITQIKMPKKVGTFLGKYPWWSPVLIKSQGNITEAGPEHWHFSWTFSIFSGNRVCRTHR